MGQGELVILKAFTSICCVVCTNTHVYTQTHRQDGLSGSKACPLSIKRYTLWPQKHATLGAYMASASQLPEPRHGAEGGAWGRDKPFLPWSPQRHGDRTGLEPQLSTTDNIHMSVTCVCACGWMDGCVLRGRCLVKGMHVFGVGGGRGRGAVFCVGDSMHRCTHLHVWPNSQISQLRQNKNALS